MALRAGLLNKRVTIESATETRDSFGEPDKIWSTFATRWASIQYEEGREFFAAGADRTERPALIRMRHTSGITEKMRVVHGSTVFQILAVENVGERGEETRIKAVVRG